MIVELARKAQEKIKPVRQEFDESGEFPWKL